MKFTCELKPQGRNKPAAHVLTIPAGQPDAETGLEAFRALADTDEARAQEAIARLAEAMGAKFGVEPMRVALHDCLLRMEQPLLHATAAQTQAAMFHRQPKPGQGVRIDRRAPRPF